MKYQKCERCRDEHTDKCENCGPEIDPEQSTMKLAYTFVLAEGICEIEGLHSILDYVVMNAGLGLVKSTLESPDEICEHDFEEGADQDA